MAITHRINKTAYQDAAWLSAIYPLLRGYGATGRDCAAAWGVSRSEAYKRLGLLRAAVLVRLDGKGAQMRYRHASAKRVGAHA